MESQAFDDFLDTAQSKVVERIGVGSIAGYMALNLGSVWIAYTIATRQGRTKFRTWFHFCNPFVTIVWVSAASYFLPEPLDFYVRGSMGTWGVLFLNVGTTFVLRNNQTGDTAYF